MIDVGEKDVNEKQYYIGSIVLPTFKQILKNVQDIIYPQAELRFGTYNDTAYTDYSQFDLETLYRDAGFICRTSFTEEL